jgi:hypothetical protein
MNLATLCHDPATSTWSAEYDGQIIVKSVGGESSKQYVISRITEGKCSKALRLNITGFMNTGMDFAPSPISDSISKAYVPQGPRLKPNNQLTVEERFELLDECVNIAISAPQIRSLIITGEGSVGKTYHTKEMIKSHGLVSTEEALVLAHTLTPKSRLLQTAF